MKQKCTFDFVLPNPFSQIIVAVFDLLKHLQWYLDKFPRAEIDEPTPELWYPRDRIIVAVRVDENVRVKQVHLWSLRQRPLTALLARVEQDLDLLGLDSENLSCFSGRERSCRNHLADQISQRATETMSSYNVIVRPAFFIARAVSLGCPFS